LCCPIMCLYVLNSVLWCLLRFLHENDVRFVFISSCFIYVICACCRKVLSNTYCVLFLFCFSSSCILLYNILLPVFLDCSFLIVTSVFSNVYSIMSICMCMNTHTLHIKRSRNLPFFKSCSIEHFFRCLAFDIEN
jgi:hypothetical protein